MSLVDEKVELAKIRMKPKDDPKVLFDQITVIEATFQRKTHKIKEEEKIAAIMSQAPMKCKTLLASEQRMKADHGVDVIVTNLENMMK